jgi:hypothetical protein
MPHALPIACSLDAGGLARRQAELRAGVLREAETVERLSDGYRWRFRDAPDLLARLGAVIDAERRCCRFLSIAVTADADLGRVTLEATGPPGTVDVLEAWIGSGL